MGTLITVLIFLLCIVLVMVILVQNPKGGLAANFSASNQVLGARKTADFLEKTTWSLGIALVVLSIISAGYTGSPESTGTQEDTELREQIDDAGTIPNAPVMPQQGQGGEQPPVPAGEKERANTPPQGGGDDENKED